MTSPAKPWESTPLQNSTQVQRSAPNLREAPITTRSAPVLPPLPRNSPVVASSSAYGNSYMPYSSGYNSFGYGGGYGMPYRSSLYNSYGGYNSYGNYGMFGAYPGGFDEAERRFVQYAEESSRNTFASVESVVRAVNSISMMLDNTFFAMTSSFRAVLSVAENFGKLRSMFGHIWHSISIFRLFNYLYRKLMSLLGFKVAPKSAVSLAWNQASNPNMPNNIPPSAAGGSSWGALAFLGFLVSAPYIISKFLPKYEDKSDPSTWKSPGVRAKAAFDFIARSQNELTVQTNDEVILAPTYIQDEMRLRNSGWAFGICNGRSGVVPLNYLVIHKISNSNIGAPESQEEIPIPRNVPESAINKSHNKTKRVSFGENQIFDLEDYSEKKEIKSSLKQENSNNNNSNNNNNKKEDCNKEILSDKASTSTEL